MPNFADIKQRDWIKVSKKLGLTVMTNRGKGSHILVHNPSNNKKLTIQHNLHKFANLNIYKVFLQWGFEEDEINKYL